MSGTSLPDGVGSPRTPDRAGNARLMVDDYVDAEAPAALGPYAAAFYRLRAVGITPVNALVLAAASYDVLPASVVEAAA